MRLLCWECRKSVSTEIPEDTIIRATLVCPECFQDLCDKLRDEAKQEIEDSQSNEKPQMLPHH